MLAVANALGGRVKEREGLDQDVVASAGWKQHVEDGEWVGLEHLTTAHTSGYTIPQYVADQRVHVSTFALLRDAKAAGISQQQVNAVLHQQARNHGWVKT